MKLKVCSRKGKQAFRRAGFSFTPNPIEIEVSDEVAEILKNEAMLLVVDVVDVVEDKKKEAKEDIEEEVEEEKEVIEERKEMVEREPKMEIKFIPPKKGRPKKK